MTKPEHIDALESTKIALALIRKELKPFVRQLDSDDAAKKAQAQSVVALSIGTLRYMGARLRGKSQKGKEDPLRQELDQMRKVLVDLEKKRKANESGPDSMKKEAKSVGKAGEKKRTSPSKTVEGSATKRAKKSI